jgi:hypothetical protein
MNTDEAVRRLMEVIRHFFLQPLTQRPIHVVQIPELDYMVKQANLSKFTASSGKSRTTIKPGRAAAFSRKPMNAAHCRGAATANPSL